ncbi:large ribosomal subunit protein bL27-like [Watersipora subatra]|uniref:large ribosomal subunit protein bL27-like n=1 Tax=Watersipora subatra TaxID=2589382 RepID=UPI00355C0628
MATSCFMLAFRNKITNIPLFSKTPAVLTHQVRLSSKAAGGATKHRGHSRKIKRGILVADGQNVQRGVTLCTQLQLRYYPGENVTLGDRCTLTSVVDGKVMITRETLNPYADSPIYPGVLKGEVIERIFLHVIPHPQANKFKLVSLI